MPAGPTDRCDWGATAMADLVKFAGRFLREPSRVGAVAPSSGALGRVITSWARLEEADAVVEYGPGTGAFTPYILERLKPGATFFALEVDRALYEAFRRRFPEVPVYRDSVAQVATYLDAHGIASADCIISGLPWASFSAAYQAELMRSTVDVLTSGGRFATFAYVHALAMSSAQAFRRLLNEQFSDVGMSPVVWWNLPPAFVYQCVK